MVEYYKPTKAEQERYEKVVKPQIERAARGMSAEELRRAAELESRLAAEEAAKRREAISLEAAYSPATAAVSDRPSVEHAIGVMGDVGRNVGAIREALMAEGMSASTARALAQTAVSGYVSVGAGYEDPEVVEIAGRRYRPAVSAKALRAAKEKHVRLTGVGLRQQAATRFQERFGYSVGDPIRPYESRRVLGELETRFKGLESQIGTLDTQMEDLRKHGPEWSELASERDFLYRERSAVLDYISAAKRKKEPIGYSAILAAPKIRPFITSTTPGISGTGFKIDIGAALSGGISKEALQDFGIDPADIAKGEAWILSKKKYGKELVGYEKGLAAREAALAKLQPFYTPEEVLPIGVYGPPKPGGYDVGAALGAGIGPATLLTAGFTKEQVAGIQRGMAPGFLPGSEASVREREISREAALGELAGLELPGVKPRLEMRAYEGPEPSTIEDRLERIGLHLPSGFRGESLFGPAGLLKEYLYPTKEEYAARYMGTIPGRPITEAAWMGKPEPEVMKWFRGAPIVGPALSTGYQWEYLSPWQRGIGIGEVVGGAALVGIPVFRMVRMGRPAPALKGAAFEKFELGAISRAEMQEIAKRAAMSEGPATKAVFTSTELFYPLHKGKFPGAPGLYSPTLGEEWAIIRGVEPGRVVTPRQLGFTAKTMPYTARPYYVGEGPVASPFRGRGVELYQAPRFGPGQGWIPPGGAVPPSPLPGVAPPSPPRVAKPPTPGLRSGYVYEKGAYWRPARGVEEPGGTYRMDFETGKTWVKVSPGEAAGPKARVGVLEAEIEAPRLVPGRVEGPGLFVVEPEVGTGMGLTREILRGDFPVGPPWVLPFLPATPGKVPHVVAPTIPGEVPRAVPVIDITTRGLPLGMPSPLVVPRSGLGYGYEVTPVAVPALAPAPAPAPASMLWTPPPTVPAPPITVPPVSLIPPPPVPTTPTYRIPPPGPFWWPGFPGIGSGYAIGRRPYGGVYGERGWVFPELVISFPEPFGEGRIERVIAKRKRVPYGAKRLGARVVPGSKMIVRKGVRV